MKLTFSRKNGDMPTRSEFPGMLRHELTTESFGRHLLYRESVDSTNRIASSWAMSGAPEGAVVFAEFQTAGKGRMNRSWVAEPEKNIMASIILRPKQQIEHPGWIPLATGVALLEAVASLTDGLSIKLKWPNDLMVNGKKCAGILSETATGDSRVLVLGIGLNVNQEEFPESLRDSATSILLETGQFVSRPVLFAGILKHLESRIGEVYQNRMDSITRVYLNNLAGVGEEITVRNISGKTAKGILTGIATDGSLLLMTESGEERFYAGDVSLSGRRD